MMSTPTQLPEPPGRGPNTSFSGSLDGIQGGQRDRFATLLLGLALLLGLLRFVRLGRWSLWLDEVFTWGDGHSALSGHYNDIGYHLVRWTVEAMGQGPTETSLRLLPAVVGFLCVPMTAWAFRPLAGSRRAALAALVVAVSAWQIQWAQTARFYTLSEFMVLLGSGLAIRGLLRASVLWIIAGVGAAGAGVLFQLQGVVIAGGLGAAAAIAWRGFGEEDPVSQRRAARRAFAILVPLGLIALPFAWAAWGRYVHNKSISDPIGSVVHFGLSSASFATPAVLAMAAAGLGLGVFAKDRRVLFVAAVILLPAAALAVAATQAVVTAQYVFALFPWLALAAAWPIGSARLQAVRGFPVAWSGVLVLPLLAGTALYMTVGYGQRARWREATEYVMERLRPGDLVASNPAAVVEFYLTGATEIDVRSPDTVLQFGRWDARSWETWARSGRRIWFIVRADYLYEMWDVDRLRFRAFLSEDCRRMETFPVRVEARDLEIEVWRFDG